MMVLTVNNPQQDHQEIDLDDLVLWSENPREPIGEKNSVEEIIIPMALHDKRRKWDLPKLLEDMGSHYDESELPTVVKKDEKYIVYDGNRRIALIKYLKDPSAFKMHNPFEGCIIPNGIKNISKIPCNVCSEETALYNIRRKHIDSSSWGTLERDIFLHKYIKEEKSKFLLFDEKTDLISKNPKMNQRFVKEDVIIDSNMNNIGFDFKDGSLQSIYNDEDSKLILEGLTKIIIEEKITTRKRLVAGTLRERIIREIPELKDKIEPIKERPENLSDTIDIQLGRVPITSKSKMPKILMFPENLHLKEGDVNDIYRDIKAIDDFYQKNKNKFTLNFPRILRFSLRILIEVASNSTSTKGIPDYLEKHFEDAKNDLSKDEKTMLSSNDMVKSELSRLLRTGGHDNREDIPEGEKNGIELLHTGAHNYTDSTDYKTACTMSIIIGAMLQISHGIKDLES